MGLFSSKDHLYNYLEEVVVDRNFLNLHKSIKNFDNLKVAIIGDILHSRVALSNIYALLTCNIFLDYL